MAKFKYRAKNQEGQVITSTAVYDTKDSCINNLRKNGIFVTYITEINDNDKAEIDINSTLYKFIFFILGLPSLFLYIIFGQQIVSSYLTTIWITTLICSFIEISSLLFLFKVIFKKKILVDFGVIILIILTIILNNNLIKFFNIYLDTNQPIKYHVKLLKKEAKYNYYTLFAKNTKPKDRYSYLCYIKSWIPNDKEIYFQVNPSTFDSFYEGCIFTLKKSKGYFGYDYFEPDQKFEIKSPSDYPSNIDFPISDIELTKIIQNNKK